MFEALVLLKGTCSYKNTHIPIHTVFHAPCLLLFAVAGSAEGAAAAGRFVVAGLDLHQHPVHH